MGLGDCYSVHGLKILEGGKYILCHGSVYRDVVGWHGHCWLEYTYERKFNAPDFPGIELSIEMVRDESNGESVDIAKSIYYMLGHIKDVKRYTPTEAARMMDKTGNFGPWEEE